MALLILYMVGHHCVVVALPSIGLQLETVSNNRYLAVMGVLPSLHVCMLTFSDTPMRLRSNVACLAQSALFLLALRIRGSLLWAVLFLSALLAVWISAKWLKQSTRPSLRRLKGTKLVQSMTTDVQISPVMLLLSVVCLAMLLKPLFLHPIYRERSDLSGHVIWHSVALGLAIHPAINEVYNGSDKVRAQVRPRASRRYEKTLLGRWVNWRSLSLLWGGRLGKWLHDPDTRKNWGFLVRCVYGVLYRPDDQDAYTAAFSWENSHGASETSLFLFEPAESVNWSSTYRYFGRREIPGSRPFDDRVDFNWRKYEDVLYLVCKRTVWEYPIQTLELALVIKPLRFGYYYLTSL